jgi:hypothetical protein
MSATQDVLNVDAPKISLLDQLKAQHMGFLQQKEFAQNNLNQLIGAIFACEQMIKRHEDDAKSNQTDDLGGQGDGGTDDQTQEQAT